MKDKQFKANNISDSETERYINPDDFHLPRGYKIEAIADHLNRPISMVFTANGDLLIAESGINAVSSRIFRFRNGQFEVLAEYYNMQITGINYLGDVIYVSHKNSISTLMPDGTSQELLSGFPSQGDFGLSRVTFGRLDHKMYFGLGTATNSGVVGLDNTWVEQYPDLHDYPGSDITLFGQNFKTINLSSPNNNMPVYTGAFSTFGVPNKRNVTRKGTVKASGSILKADTDGTGLELVAWGFRNISDLHFDVYNRLFILNQGYNIRGSRPIANAEDEFHMVTPGIWYGWPDYVGNIPVNNPRFRPEGGEQPTSLLTTIPNVPPAPFAVFPASTTVMGFDFNYYESFGPVGDAYVAELGNVWPRKPGDNTPYIGVGHRISKIDMSTGAVSTFAINKSGLPYVISGEGAFGRPADVAFGPDGALYVLDMGISVIENFSIFLPNTGVLWKISRMMAIPQNEPTA